MRAGGLKKVKPACVRKSTWLRRLSVMRDPVLYRIRVCCWNTTRLATNWCIYPMYDFTHCISDALEGITHSLCTLRFRITVVCMTGYWTTSHSVHPAPVRILAPESGIHRDVKRKETERQYG
uniref:Glutamine--tRNA ligase n=1 Tax=Salmonella sp. TaxID=599 RepID=A0A482ETN1_SALSP|nr:Glutamine--tRNA ligase [Salmonella sp.]